MAGKIKGITIAFEGDTTKLDRALRDVNKSTKDIDKELRNVNRDLKFNPTSVELWKQKQELLSQKVEDTKDKLDLLKQKQEQMDAAGVEKNSAEYRELQREIIETESKLTHFKGQLDAVGSANIQAVGEKFQEVGGKIQAVGDKMQEIGKGMSTYVTAPIVAGGGLALKAFQDVDAGMDIVVQKTGATGEALDGMKGIVEDLATTMPISFETAGNAVGELNTRFGVTGDDLQKLSEKFIQFSELNGVDVVNSIDTVQKALSAFGLGAEDAGTILDRMNVVGQQTGASMDVLMNGLVQNGTAFQEMGLSAEQAVIFMGQMETSGANAETVMQGLRKALKNSAADGLSLDEALATLQDQITNGTNGMDGLTAAYDLFGKSGDQIYGAVKNGTVDFTALGAAADSVAGSVENTFANTVDPIDTWQMTLNEAKLAAADIGATLGDILLPILQQVGEWVQVLRDKWNELSPEQQEMIVKIAGIVAVVGPLLMIIGKVVSVVGAIISGVGTLISLAPAIGGAITIAMGPIGIIIGVIAAVIAAGVLLYKNWDTIKEKLTELGAKIKQIWNNIKSSIMNVVNNIKSSLSNAWNTIKSAATTAFNAVKNAIVNPITTAKTLISNAIQAIKNLFSGLKLELPKFKLPHFKISGGKMPWGIGGKGEAPKISVDWYAQGGIFNSPSIIGVGEAGSEAVVPLDKFWDKLDNMSAGGDNIVINVYAADGMSVRQLAEEVKRQLIATENRRRLAWQ